MLSILAISLALLPTPQGGNQEVRAVGVDENGWPIFAPAEAASPPAPVVDSAPVAEREPVPAARPAPARLPVESPLRDVFARVGQPADLEDLGGVVAWSRFVIRDHRGGELAVREVTHEADLGFPARDRLLLPGRKVYGRDGSAVWAELHRLPMPSYEAEAADELELFGLLLRMPWAFADESRFRVGARGWETRGSTRLERIVVERAGDPAAPDRAPDRFELLCDPHTHDPIELRYQLGETGGGQRRLLLSSYRRVGGVRVPMRRVLVDDADRPLVEWTLERIDAEQRFPQAQFRPALR